jgi:hypothetical protein
MAAYGASRSVAGRSGEGLFTMLHQNFRPGEPPEGQLDGGEGNEGGRGFGKVSKSLARRRLRPHCGATCGTLFLFDGETFRGVAIHGYPQDMAEQWRRGISVRQTSVWEPLLAGAPSPTLPIFG